MNKLTFKLGAFFCLILSNSALVATINPCPQEIALQAVPFTDTLSLIDSQFQESSYREQLYYVISEEGVHRLLIVINPEHEKIKKGFLSIGSGVVVGFEKDFPEDYLEQITLLIKEREIEGVFVSGGTYNGKTIIELFDY